MNRTRKWSMVAQEAKRLVALKMSPAEIAKRLQVNKSTVTRWMASGKIPKAKTASATPKVLRSVKPVKGRQSPAQWALAVRKEYALDATDDQLVTLAQSALALSQDVTVSPNVRLSASARFESLSKRLSLTARHEADKDAAAKSEAAAAPEAAPVRPRPTNRPDPRKVLH